MPCRLTLAVNVSSDARDHNDQHSIMGRAAFQRPANKHKLHHSSGIPNTRCVHARRLEACLHQAKHAAASLQVHSNSWGAAKLDVDVYRQVGTELACFIDAAPASKSHTCAAHMSELCCCAVIRAHHVIVYMVLIPIVSFKHREACAAAVASFCSPTWA